MSLPPEVQETYEVLGRIREGGMGSVYKVRHRRLGVLRVVKILHSGMRADPDLAERFVREARLGGGLSHPNLAQILDLSADYTWAVMELIDGLPLDERLRREGPLPVALALEVARQTLDGLAYLHRKGSVHRDVSPDNLMLTRYDDGRPLVKLIDLGIAKSLRGTGRITAEGMFLGKPRYASPEQITGDRIDARSDLYSFGLVLYELLTGRLPFEAASSDALMRERLFKEPLGFDVTDPSGRIPPDLRAAVLRALKRDPEGRFPGAEAFARELTAIQVRFPLAVEDPGVTQAASSGATTGPGIPIAAVVPFAGTAPKTAAPFHPDPPEVETRQSVPPPEVVHAAPAAPAVPVVPAVPAGLPLPDPVPKALPARGAAPARRNLKKILAVLVLFGVAALLLGILSTRPWLFGRRDGPPATAAAEPLARGAADQARPAGDAAGNPGHAPGQAAGRQPAPSGGRPAAPGKSGSKPEEPQRAPAGTVRAGESRPAPAPPADREPRKEKEMEEARRKPEAPEPAGATPRDRKKHPAGQQAQPPGSGTISPQPRLRSEKPRDGVVNVPLELVGETPPPATRRPAGEVEWVAAVPITPLGLVIPAGIERHEGTVRMEIQVYVGKEGDVTEARVIRFVPAGLPQRAELEKAALAGARQVKFRPGTENGVPIASWQVLTYTF